MKNKLYTKKELSEFLDQSNAIEREYSMEAYHDAHLAWSYAYRYRKNITFRYILEIHKRLMQRLRPDIAGKLRNCDVWIGRKIKIFISKTLLKEDLMQIYIEMNDSMARTKKEKELECKQTHILFEGIHPFEDGNGRVGRILYNIQRLNVGLPLHIIHTGEEQWDYYQWFD